MREAVWFMDSISLRPRVPSWIWIRWILYATHRNNFMSPPKLTMLTAMQNYAPTPSYFVSGQHFLETFTLLPETTKTKNSQWLQSFLSSNSKHDFCYTMVNTSPSTHSTMSLPNDALFLSNFSGSLVYLYGLPYWLLSLLIFDHGAICIAYQLVLSGSYSRYALVIPPHNWHEVFFLFSFISGDLQDWGGYHTRIV